MKQKPAHIVFWPSKTNFVRVGNQYLKSYFESDFKNLHAYFEGFDVHDDKKKVLHIYSIEGVLNGSPQLAEYRMEPTISQDENAPYCTGTLLSPNGLETWELTLWRHYNNHMRCYLAGSVVVRTKKAKSR